MKDIHKDNYKVVILDGFSDEELSLVIKTLKHMFQGRDIIFARPTPYTRQWPVEKLISALHEEIEEHKAKQHR